MDDLFNNTLGALIEIVFYILISKVINLIMNSEKAYRREDSS